MILLRYEGVCFSQAVTHEPRPYRNKVSHRVLISSPDVLVSIASRRFIHSISYETQRFDLPIKCSPWGISPCSIASYNFVRPTQSSLRTCRSVRNVRGFISSST